MHDKFFLRRLDLRAKANGHFFADEVQRIGNEIGEPLTEQEIEKMRLSAEEATRIIGIKLRNNQL